MLRPDYGFYVEEFAREVQGAYSTKKTCWSHWCDASKKRAQIVKMIAVIGLRDVRLETEMILRLECCNLALHLVIYAEEACSSIDSKPVRLANNVDHV